MDEQAKFRTALAALSANAEQKNRKLTQADVQAFLQDMNFSEEQYALVYAYLASKRIRVEGVELPKVSEEEVPYTEEEQEFLKQYQKELKMLKGQTLVERYMGKVLEIAKDYAHQGLLIQDLVQEGNLGLMIGIETLGLKAADVSEEDHLEQEIRTAIQAALDEYLGAKDTGEQITDKLNKLADSITSLTEDLGREVTPEELSMYLDIPLEEIEDLLTIAGENIETAEEV